MAICSESDLKRYLTDTFVETGSYFGDSIQFALDCGFKQVRSIELSDHHYLHCKKRFADNNSVILYHGDSLEKLEEVIAPINTRCTFWLDGHYSACDTAFGKKEFPLIEELIAIKNHHIKNHIILIDDIRCWDQIHFKLSDIKNLILEIDKNYKFEILNCAYGQDILVAYH